MSKFKLLDILNSKLEKYSMKIEKVNSYYHLILSDNTVIKLTSIDDCIEIVNLISMIEHKTKNKT